MSTDQRTLVLKKSDGSEKRVQCRTEVFNMLLSKETDPSVKSLVLQSLLNEEKSDLPSSFSRSDDQHSASSDTSSFTSASSSRSESPITCENTSNTHVWKAEEEDVLVNLRHEKNEKFLKSKNHSTLWKEITAQLDDTLHCIVTPNQAMNKYYSLKKRWKEVVDAPTGTERKYFRQKEQFDEIYGTRESTKPTITLDTLEKNPERQGPKQSSEQPRRNKGTAKRRSDVLEVLERHNKQFNDKMEQMHTDKMARLDRLLNLYEREIESKESCNK